MWLNGSDNPPPHEREKKLRALTVPTLLLAGERDAAALESTRELEALLPNAKRVVIARPSRLGDRPDAARGIQAPCVDRRAELHGDSFP